MFERRNLAALLAGATAIVIVVAISYAIVRLVAVAAVRFIRFVVCRLNQRRIPNFYKLEIPNCPEPPISIAITALEAPRSPRSG
jgi:hypothetical protein